MTSMPAEKQGATNLAAIATVGAIDVMAAKDRATPISALPFEWGKAVALHDDLLPYLSTIEALGMPCLKHPLVFSVPHFEPLNGYVNQALAYKQMSLKESVEKRNLHTFVATHERPYRLDAIQAYSSLVGFDPANSGESIAYWSTLAWAWCDSENIHEDPDGWIELLKNPPDGVDVGLRAQAMHDDERSTLLALPDEITVYHGEERDDEIGWSWTLSQDVALWFAKRFSNTEHRATYSGTVSKADVLIYLGRRNEQEVIVNPDDVKMLLMIEPEKGAFASRAARKLKKMCP